MNIDALAVPTYETLSNPLWGPPLIIIAGLVLAQYASLIIVMLAIGFGSLPILLQSFRNAKPQPTVNWWDEIVLITGGSHGVGLELVNLLVKLGPKKIVVFDLNECPVKDEKVCFYRCDVSSADDVDAVAKKVISEVGQPTIIVNNAGIVMGKLFMDTTDKQMEKIINVNLLGPMRISKAFLPGLMSMK
ncbi:hypothetical protein HDU76_005927, partial [Blyttiomyces sp. JEL0837]